jgi:hypothetical protein
MKERERDRQQEFHTGSLLLRFTAFEEILLYFFIDTEYCRSILLQRTAILSSIALLNETAPK